MNEPRNLRFLIPPFFFFFWALLAGYFADVDFKAQLDEFSTNELLAITAVIGATSLPIGYLLTSISILFLKAIARFFGSHSHTYEAHLSDKAFKTIWRGIKASRTPNRDFELYAVATYDHSVLRKEVHEWIQRRWNSFNIAAHSCTAILLSQATVLLLGVRYTCGFAICSLLMLVVLGSNAYVAWRHVMKMIEFQASLKQKKLKLKK